MPWTEVSLLAPVCDKCGHAEGSLGVPPGQNVRAAQLRAESFGWSFREDKMYCWRCW